MGKAPDLLSEDCGLESHAGCLLVLLSTWGARLSVLQERGSLAWSHVLFSVQAVGQGPAKRCWPLCLEITSLQKSCQTQGPAFLKSGPEADLAQLAGRLLRDQKVADSSPAGSPCKEGLAKPVTKGCSRESQVWPEVKYPGKNIRIALGDWQ